MMETENKKEYLPPLLMSFDISVEKGFASSSGSDMTNPIFESDSWDF